MFMVFTQAHDPHNGVEATKICLNLKTVDSIQQFGQWEPVPLDEVNLDAPAPARRPGRPVQARQDRFVIHPDRVMIMVNGGRNQYTVMGDFDQLCEALAQFREQRETV